MFLRTVNKNVKKNRDVGLFLMRVVHLNSDFRCVSSPQALDAAELEKEQFCRGQHTGSPVSSDWHTVALHTDCTPAEPQTSPHLVASSGEGNPAYTTISVSPLAAHDRNQDNAGNTAPVNGEPRGSRASPEGGNGESAMPSSGRCAGPWSSSPLSCAAVACNESWFFMLKPDSPFQDVVDALPAEAQTVDPEEGEHPLPMMDNGTGKVCFHWPADVYVLFIYHYSK